MSIPIPELHTLAILRIVDEMPTRDALRTIARYLDGMLNSGELRRLPRITQARVRAIQMEAERLCNRDDWRVRRGVWWRLRRWWRAVR